MWSKKDNVTTAVSYTCQPYFVLTKKQDIYKCVDGKWETPPKCLKRSGIRTSRHEFQREIMCDPPKLSNAEILKDKKSSYKINSTIKYTCHSGFEPEEYTHITCGSQGQWMHEPKNCEYHLEFLFALRKFTFAILTQTSREGGLNRGSLLLARGILIDSSLNRKQCFSGAGACVDCGAMVEQLFQEEIVDNDTEGDGVVVPEIFCPLSDQKLAVLHGLINPLTSLLNDTSYIYRHLMSFKDIAR
ncbi:hypothetical protein QQF64_019022 [Cirrhinus molitorella]|uniref:Sushi domain-containing protein n=1 Tax=Cirrhinus molitorella TaxID=172907 RepID=A0ABR3LEA8_9TELE